MDTVWEKKLREGIETPKKKKITLSHERIIFEKRLDNIMRAREDDPNSISHKEGLIKDAFDMIELFLDLIPCKEETRTDNPAINKFEIIDV